MIKRRDKKVDGDDYSFDDIMRRLVAVPPKHKKHPRKPMGQKDEPKDTDDAQKH